jgi:hypothetical protein
MRAQISKPCAVVGVIVVAIVLAMIYAQPAKAQAQTIKQKFNVPLDDAFHAADPAVGGCLIEDVHVFGTLPTQTQTVIDGKGGVHLKFQQIADLSAVGLSTGDTYHTQGPLVFVEYDFDGAAPREAFFHNIVQLIGPGQDGNLNVHVLLHVVFNANGVQTVTVDKEDVRCH